MFKLHKSGSCSISPFDRISLFLAFIAIALSGCGGGGGGGDDTPITGSGSMAPVANAATLAITEDVPVSSALNASAPSGHPLTYSIVTDGSLGSAVINDPASGAYTYTPNPDEFGSDSFTFKVNDGVRDSNTATVTVQITPVEDLPVASPATFSTDEDVAANSTLEGSDPDGDPVTFIIVSSGTLGTATLVDASTGDFTYTPDPDAYGTDIVTFRANDGKAYSNLAAVTITVNPVNDVPAATGSCNTTRQSITYAGTLTGSDLESGGMLTFSLEDGTSGPFITTKGGEVTITDQTTGAFTYKPKSALDHGDRGTDTFVFQVDDPDGGQASATETIIVDKAIMPLGDSITQGTIDGPVPTADQRVAYRKPLYDLLKAAGYGFDFVGTLTDGYGVPDFDFNNEGNGGYTASEIAWGRIMDGSDGVFAWLEANPSDIILLHAGTNGLDPNGDIDIEAILDEIDRWENSAGGNPVTVILALIIDKAPNDPNITAFNNNVYTMAGARIDGGDDIIIVDQQNNAGIVYTVGVDMGSTLHPNESGYAKMADVWFNPVANLLAKCP